MDHEERTAADLDRQRLQAADRFWRTRDYNPITSGFYDPDKVRALAVTPVAVSQRQLRWLELSTQRFERTDPRLHVSPCCVRKQEAAFTAARAEKEKLHPIHAYRTLPPKV